MGDLRACLIAFLVGLLLGFWVWPTPKDFCEVGEFRCQGGIEVCHHDRVWYPAVHCWFDLEMDNLTCNDYICGQVIRTPSGYVTISEEP